MKVLSLFDGISCARVALERAGIPVEAYFASEIDKYAIQVSKKNYPSIEHVGDVEDVFFYREDWKEILPINLLIGGSPCQDLSIAKKDRKGLDGERSGLFWEYVRILKEVKPKYFILENVASMSEDSKNIISKELGVLPILFDAKLVSAQNRKRLFWTNIPNVTLPEDVGLKISDIMEFEVDIKYFETPKNTVRKNEKNWQWDTSGKGYNSQQDRATHISQKSKTLPASRTEDKCKIFYGETCRKLTPIECERLQGLPDNYTEGISNTQRYKCLGNAFNVDVVTHILSFIKPTNS